MWQTHLASAVYVAFSLGVGFQRPRLFRFPLLLARDRCRSRCARGGFVCSNCWSALGVAGNPQKDLNPTRKRHLHERITPTLAGEKRKLPDAARPSNGRFQTKLR